MDYDEQLKCWMNLMRRAPMGFIGSDQARELIKATHGYALEEAGFYHTSGAWLSYAWNRFTSRDMRALLQARAPEHVAAFDHALAITLLMES